MLKKPKRKPLRYILPYNQAANSGQKNDPEASAFYLSPNAMHMITFKIYGKKP